MYTKASKKGSVRFSIKPAGGASKVQLVGSFSDWQPLTMRRQKDGAFVKVVSLPPGIHEYKFIVDGEWHRDPDHSNWAMNPYGTLNSVVEI